MTVLLFRASADVENSISVPNWNRLRFSRVPICEASRTTARVGNCFPSINVLNGSRRFTGRYLSPKFACGERAGSLGLYKGNQRIYDLSLYLRREIGFANEVFCQIKEARRFVRAILRQ